MTPRTFVACQLLLVVACDSRKDAQKTPAEVASALVGDDVSPLDLASARPANGGQEPWSPELCDVVPEKDRPASLSNLELSGACSFVHHGIATCKGRGDDYYAIFKRKLADGSDVELYLNVETYVGAGLYEKKGQLLVLVRRGQSLYRWSNDEATVTLGFDEGVGLSAPPKNTPEAQGPTPTVVQIPPTDLVAQPGTPTRGTISLKGTIACVLKKNPK